MCKIYKNAYITLRKLSIEKDLKINQMLELSKMVLWKAGINALNNLKKMINIMRKKIEGLQEKYRIQ